MICARIFKFTYNIKTLDTTLQTFTTYINWFFILSAIVFPRESILGLIFSYGGN